MVLTATMTIRREGICHSGEGLPVAGASLLQEFWPGAEMGGLEPAAVEGQGLTVVSLLAVMYQGSVCSGCREPQLQFLASPGSWGGDLLLLGPEEAAIFQVKSLVELRTVLQLAAAV